MLVLVAVSLVMMMAFLALALDLGNARQVRRQAQVSADAASLAGAQDLLSGSWSWPSVVSRVKSYAANDFGVAAGAWTNCVDAQALSFQPDAANSDACISSDSGSSPTQLRVRIPTRTVQTNFAQVLGFSGLNVSASATTSLAGATVCALCVLSPSASPALTDSGNGNVAVTGGGVQVNSTAATAVSLSGNGDLDADVIGGPAAPAGFRTSGTGRYSPAPIRQPAVTDPLAKLAMCPAAGTPSPCPTTVRADVYLSGSSGRTLSPGIYNNIVSSGNGPLTLNPGTYIITGTFTVSGNGPVTATGVTLYFACSTYPTPCPSGGHGAALALTGNGSVALTPPSTGPFQGLAVFYDRSNTSAGSLTGNGGTPATGTIYMKSAPLTLTGNGSTSTLNSMMVVDRVITSGNGDINVTYNAAQNVPLKTIGLSQ